MKQYVKNKPIKWGFKFWFRCASKTGYLQEMDMYLGKKQQVEHSLGEGVVIQLSQKLNDTYCTPFFDNFFNSFSLVETLYQRGIYGIGTFRKDRKHIHMPSMVPDKAMKRGDHEFQYSDKAISCKWFDNRAVNLLGSNVEGFDAVSDVSRRQKGAPTKVNVSCPAMVKIYNHEMVRVDLMDPYTAAYRLDRRARFRFYLRIFFDLWDVGCSNSYIVFNQIFPKRLKFLNYKIGVGKALIGAFCSRERSFPSARASKRRFSQVSRTEASLQLPEHIDK